MLKKSLFLSKYRSQELAIRIMHEATRSLKNLCTIVFWAKRDKGCVTLLKNIDRKTMSNMQIIIGCYPYTYIFLSSFIEK